MERIPFDVIINHIIPYTYNVKSNILFGLFTKDR